MIHWESRVLFSKPQDRTTESPNDKNSFYVTFFFRLVVVLSIKLFEFYFSIKPALNYTFLNYSQDSSIAKWRSIVVLVMSLCSHYRRYYFTRYFILLPGFNNVYVRSTSYLLFYSLRWRPGLINRCKLCPIVARRLAIISLRRCYFWDKRKEKTFRSR